MADLRIQYTEEMVGNGHPTKADTLNRLANVEHGIDGTHPREYHFLSLPTTNYQVVTIADYSILSQVVTLAGTYMILAHAMTSSNTSPPNMHLYVKVGATYPSATLKLHKWVNGYARGTETLDGCVVLALNAGDKVHLGGEIPSNCWNYIFGDADYPAATTLTIFRMGP